MSPFPFRHICLAGNIGKLEILAVLFPGARTCMGACVRGIFQIFLSTAVWQTSGPINEAGPVRILCQAQTMQKQNKTTDSDILYVRRTSSSSST